MHDTYDNEMDMLHFEKMMRADGIEIIAGVDEAGRGPLAGPVAAAAVILPPGVAVEGANDSKKLTSRERRRLEGVIKATALAWAVCLVFPPHLDEVNILNATREAMVGAVQALSVRPQGLIIDAISIPLEVPQLAVIKGDARSMSVACASILAKEERDRVMTAFSEVYPGYGFERHKGYASRQHLEALQEMGPCPIHRRSFAPVRGRATESIYVSESLFD